MKKYVSYSLIILLAVAVGFLFFTSENKPGDHFDERITLRVKDKIPYGTYVAFEGLRHLFPTADLVLSKNQPGSWDSLSRFDGNQALVIVAGNFYPDGSEMKKMVEFVEKGNDVFISAMDFSYDASEVLKCDINAVDGMMYGFSDSESSNRLSVSLAQPPFRKKTPYTYPGKRFDFYFYKFDTTTTTVLGYDKNNNPNFIHLKAGKGNLFIHLAPLAFSNYFLLHRNNITYLENAFSVLSPSTKRIVWNEYFNARPVKQNKTTNWLSVFLRYPSLKWALLTALLTLLLYVFSEMRRKQRIIPVIHPPKNDSLEFVKTIGRLYHDKGDHRNLCRKMSAYFLEHVRSRYKLPTTELNEDFIKNLGGKSGVAEAEIRDIVSSIAAIESTGKIHEKQLAGFHKQLESFYKQA